MSARLRKTLPWIAMACALFTVLGIASLSFWRVERLVDTGETLARVEESLEPVRNLQPNSIYQAEFLSAVDEFAAVQNLATLWLLQPNGELVHAAGATWRSFPQGSAEQFSSPEIQRVLSALPDDALSGEQETLIHVASAIQREGEHNDIYGHIVRQIMAPDGSVVALIGIAYKINPDEVGLGWKVLVLASLVALLVYWLALPLWTWLDARQRGERAWPWAVFVLLGNLMALLAYLLTRAPRHTRLD